MSSNSYLSACMCPMGAQPHLYRNPRYLRCLHSFCKDCLQEACGNPESSEPARKAIVCPTCLVTTETGDVDYLPFNLRLARESKGAAILAKVHSAPDSPPVCEKCIAASPAELFCLGCTQFICQECELVHQSFRELVNHKRVTFDDMDKLDPMTFLPPKPVRCSGDQSIAEAICYHGLEYTVKCYKCDRCRGNEAECQQIITASKEKKKEITDKLSWVTEALEEIEEFIQKNQETQRSLRENAKKAKIMVNEAFSDHTTLDMLGAAKESDVLHDLDRITNSKETRLCLHREKMEKLKDHLSSRKQVVEDLLSKYTDEEIVCGAQSLCSAIEDVRPEFVGSLPLRVGETAFLDVIVDQSMESFCRVSGGCCPEESVIVTQQISRGIVYTERELIVEARDESGHPYRRGGEEVTANMLDCSMKEWFPTYDTVDKGNGSYVVKARPRYCGRYELHVNIREQPIKGSPFTIYARRDRHYRDTDQWSPDTITLPSKPGSAAPGDCYIYVCEYLGKHIYEIGLGWYRSGNDNVVRVIPVQEAKQLRGIATLRHEILFVTDRGANEVVKLTNSGEVIARFGGRGSQAGQFNSPTGIAVDEDGRIYVGEYDGKRVQIFNSDFTHHLTIQLDDHVQGVALDTFCSIHITQATEGHIKVYNPKGEYLRAYGHGELCDPQEVYVDERNYCLVTHSGDKPVKVFDSGGNLIHSFGSEMQSAQGICITPYGLHGPFIYVCDRDEQKWFRY